MCGMCQLPGCKLHPQDNQWSPRRERVALILTGSYYGYKRIHIHIHRSTFKNSMIYATIWYLLMLLFRDRVLLGEAGGV